ncbi:hypothetical protein O7626_40585 [Micromonospora sp. WMMD1102]|uniref:hypothetical protein n=1 Tax=Micromonospora sp. WMMD1102 TaxID=3016105 RepID=UPI002415457D|nr:hypothetical protein [Micromonospora sp. WMMD1102]MDG4792115.1 hypothetical protein [Micromonospora sp. WMMD1102]
MKAIRVRHEQAPTPMGCRWCGVGQRDHGQRWVPGKDFHGYEPPTQKQINARLRVKYKSRVPVHHLRCLSSDAAEQFARLLLDAGRLVRVEAVDGLVVFPHALPRVVIEVAKLGREVGFVSDECAADLLVTLAGHPVDRPMAAVTEIKE